MSITKPTKSRQHTSKINHLLQPRRVTFDKATFINNVCNNKYVLVIGSEVILNKEKHADVDGDIQKYILKRLNSALGRLTNPFPSLNTLVASRPSTSTDEELSGADMIRNLLIPEEVDEDEYNNDMDYYSEQGEGNELQEIGNEAEQVENAITLDDLSLELSNLLNTRLFRFVMTTTFDSNVELLMRLIWGEELRVVNIADQDDWKKFQMEIGSSLDRSDFSHTVYKYSRPTLIYIFGKATEDRSKNFVKTENDAIGFIELWMKCQEPFVTMMKERRILALGCKFDDWYFRFFWYILKRDFGKLGDGEVALSLDAERPSDQNLKRYLERKHIYLHKDARQFMRDMYDMLTPEKNNLNSKEFHEIIKSKRGDGEIFLSYCSQDFILASRIFFQLTNLGYNVWFDNENLCGENYEVEICNAINKARVIITLLTPKVKEDLLNGKTQCFYNKEWRLASQINCERIIPLAADGYSLRGPYHAKQTDNDTTKTTYEDIIRGHVNGVDLMIDGFDQLVKVINNKKNN